MRSHVDRTMIRARGGARVNLAAIEAWLAQALQAGEAAGWGLDGLWVGDGVGEEEGKGKGREERGGKGRKERWVYGPQQVQLFE